MLDSLSPPRRRLIKAVVGAVVVVMVVAVAIGLARSFGGVTDPVAQDEPGPVLVVPGYGGNARSVTPIIDKLRDEGRDVTVVGQTGGDTGDLRAQAVRLGAEAKKVLRRTGAKSVDVVGYSAGGVVARLWVKDEGGASIARRVLTLGSPHHGTDVAALAAEVAGSCPTACEQLAPDSDVLRVLNAGDETPAGPRFITVRSDVDRTVSPTDSASLSGALDLVVQKICPGATTAHGDLPGDPAVLATVSSTLGAELPRAPGNVRC